MYRLTLIALVSICCWKESLATNDLGCLEEVEASGASVPRLLQSVPIVTTEPPNLSGRHFRITVIEQPEYLEINTDWDGSFIYSGYLIDILEALAREDRGNFTYELLTPSGYGVGCTPQLRKDDNVNNNNTEESVEHGNLSAYDISYRTQYTCGEGDINDVSLWNNDTGAVTDLLWGSYYITPDRLLKQKFTIPYSPPTRATLGMMGAVTHIRDLQDVAENHADDYAVCAFGETAYMASLETAFPQLDIRGVPFTRDLRKQFDDGTCEILIADYPSMAIYVRQFALDNQCLVNGMPIGIIGEPLEYGLNHFAFGVRMDLPDKVVITLNYWLQALMACFPDDPNGHCPRERGGGSLSEYYANRGGTGKECGYVQFPPDPAEGGLPVGAILAIAVTPVVIVLALAMIIHSRRLKEQERRMRKRFIQQLARNIEIGDSAHAISADKLLEAFKHIGGTDGLISKQDLAKWINDLHMDFISEAEFDRLWAFMDMDGNGYVDPIDFTTFLAECGPQFKQVHAEYSSLPKSERLKLATRRLSNFNELGEEGVRQMERRNNRRARQPIGNADLGSTLSNPKSKRSSLGDSRMVHGGSRPSFLRTPSLFGRSSVE